MKYFAALILAVLFLPACNPCSRLSRKCPPNVIIRDSIIEKTVTSLRDTLIFVPIPGQTIIDSILVPWPPSGKTHSNNNQQRLTVTGKLAKASSWINRDKLYLELTEGDTLLPVKLDNAIRETTYWKHRYHNKETVTVIPWRWWEKAFFWAGVFSLIFAVALLVYKLLK